MADYDSSAAPKASYGTPTATAQVLKNMHKTMSPEELSAWRVVDVPRPSAEERNLPKEYPFGWFAIDYIDELAIGQVKPVRFFGEEMVLWRGEDGAARLLNAYCPHYGAHLGHGGVVKGNNVECPYHAWQWDETGTAKIIPYSRTIPPQAKRAGCIPAKHLREFNAMIWMWYHPDNDVPHWEPVAAPEFRSDDFTPITKVEWNVYASYVAFADNAVDTAHLQHLHGTQNSPKADVVFDGVRRTTLAHVEFDTPRGPVAGTIESDTYGPSQGVTRFKGISETVLIAALTPIDRDHLKVRYAFTQPKTEAEGPSARLAKAIINNLCQQTDQDKIVLDHIKSFERPLICEGDGPLGPNRRFRQQFFVHRTPEAAE